MFSMFWLLRCNNNYIDFQIDDQIALLINAWCELLVFSCCYRSVNSPGLIRVSNEKSLDLATAKRFGIEKCIDKMLNFTEQLRRLKVDYYEYVSMKVIVLLTSGKLNFRYSLILIKTFPYSMVVIEPYILSFSHRCLRTQGTRACSRLARKSCTSIATIYNSAISIDSF